MGDEKWHYEWNAENRLIAMGAKDVSQHLEFRYDPHGRRISKNVFKSRKPKEGWQKKSTIHYAYDGWNIIAELDARGNSIRTHLWGFDISGSPQGAGGAGGLLASKNDRINTSAFVLYDGNGNVVQYIDADSETPIAELNYDPFGNVVGVDNVEKTIDSWPFGFSAKYVDGETGFSYYGFRYYSPVTGRWWNRDPIKENGGINLYQICQNSAINHVDLNGCFFNNFCGISSVVIGGVQAYLQDEPYSPGQITLDFIIGGIPVPGLGAAVVRAFKKCRAVRLQAWYTRKIVDSARNSKDPVTGELVGSYVNSSIRKEWGFRVEADGAVYQLAWVVTWQGVKWTSNKILEGEVDNVDELHVSIDSTIKPDGNEDTVINQSSSSKVSPIVFIE